MKLDGWLYKGGGRFDCFQPTESSLDDSQRVFFFSERNT